MHRFRRKIIALPILAALVGGGLIAASAASGDRSGSFLGLLSYQQSKAPCSVILCVTGVFQGVNGGPFDEQITSLTPSPGQPGILFGQGKIVIHNRNGDLPCDETFVFNGTPGGDQEAAILCEFRSGTGRYVGASGHFEAEAQQPPGAAGGGGRYEGRLTLP
jgi:hypothetical protein